MPFSKRALHAHLEYQKRCQSLLQRDWIISWLAHCSIMDELKENIIAILEQKRGYVDEDRDILANVIISVQNILERYYTKDNAFVKQAEVLHQFVTALQTSKKDQYPLYTRCNTIDIAADLKALIDAIKDEISTLGLPSLSKDKVSKGIQITNNVSQSQSQNQSQELNVIINILLEAVKDELNGKQRKELLAIAENAKDPQEARKGILEKLKEFGADVSASIVANILTNPSVWASLGSIL